MASTIKTWVNNNLPQCEDVDLNGFKNENNNLILGSGQSLSTGDLQQTHKAVAQYSTDGDFFSDSGLADAYVLSALAAKQAPTAYTDGMRIRFETSNPNGGGAATVNVAGLGVKSIKPRGGADPAAGDIDGRVELVYDIDNDWCELQRDNAVGVNQTLQDVSGSRAVDVTYTNTTGRPIFLSVSGYVTTDLAEIKVDGLTVGTINDDGSITNRGSVGVVVPNGSTYIWDTALSTGSVIEFWAELR